MTEPDVTLTDFALGLEGVVMALILVWRHGLSRETFPWIVYFAAAGVAAFFGGLVHGYFLEPSSWGRAIFWPLSLTAIGVNAVAAVWIGAILVRSQRVAAGLRGFSMLMLAAYVPYVVSVDSRFGVAIVIAAPAMLFLFAALWITWWGDGRWGALIAAYGVLLTLVAAAVQYFGIAFNPVYFNHNATAHVVQFTSLALIFFGCLQMIDSAPVEIARN